MFRKVEEGSKLTPLKILILINSFGECHDIALIYI